MKKLVPTGALVCTFVLALAGRASADTVGFAFTATDGSTVTAVGLIDVNAAGFATSGSINFEGPGWITFPGTYTLDTDYSETAVQGGLCDSSDPICDQSYTSPNGYFYFDNAFSGTSPYLDEAGLLFTLQVPDQQIFDDGQTTTGTLTAEASLWWDGSEYVVADDFNGPEASLNGSGFPYDADQSPNGSYQFTGTLSQTPEPGTLLLLAAGLAGVAVYRRRNRNAEVK